MDRFEPTYYAKETAKNVSEFIRTHHPVFISLIVRIAPYLLVCVIGAVYASHMSIQDLLEQIEKTKEHVKTTNDLTAYEDVKNYSSPFKWVSQFFNLAIAYLFAVVAISWHRLVLLGEDNFKPMEVLNPQRNEIEFIFVLALLTASPAIIMSFIPVSVLATGPAVIGLLIVSIVLIYLFFKFSFYFPAKAVDSSITFGQSFKLTKGYFWKMAGAYFMASIIPIVLVILYYLIASTATAPLIGWMIKSNSDSAMAFMAIPLLIQLPILFYFQPLFTIIGVTVLSNYYQHALKTKKLPEA